MKNREDVRARLKLSSAAFMKAFRNVTRQELEQYSHSRYTPQQEGNDYAPKLQHYKLEECYT
jgi:hypothetical protein